MFEKILGVFYIIIGVFIILIAATSKNPDGSILEISWFISIIGVLVVELGVITHISKGE